MCLGLQPHSHRQTYVPLDASPSLLRVYRKSTFHTDAPDNAQHRDGNHSQNPPITSRIDWFQNSFLYYDTDITENVNDLFYWHNFFYEHSEPLIIYEIYSIFLL